LIKGQILYRESYPLLQLSKGELEYMDVNTFKPPDDPIYQYLLQEAVNGRVPVFFAAVPLIFP